MRSTALALIAALSLTGQDRYPQVRALVLEAEAQSGNMRLLKDRSNPHTWAGDLLAHAGYLEDAERAYRKSGDFSSGPPVILWKAWVVYGERERAERWIESAMTPGEKAPRLLALADLLWRMGDAGAARNYYESARSLAPGIAEPRQRKLVLASIDQGLEAVSDPPPILVSSTPHPRPTSNLSESIAPPFPITTEGFQDRDPAGNTARGLADADLMTRLYERAAAGDIDGINRITETAATPFQKALAVASLEHLALQKHEAQMAEHFADTIQSLDSVSSLAKAEAISAAAAEWLRKGEVERAGDDFSAAKRLVSSVSDLPLGRISVLVSIAGTQSRNGMKREGRATFEEAIALAQKLPARPHPAPGVRRPPVPLGTHYNDEAFERIMRAAVHAADDEIVSEAVAAWKTTGESAGSTLVNVWLAEGATDQAIAAARAIEDPDARVSELLSLARNLLDRAGGPIF
jgi:tetratricopeptide (TPR) repeat protein